MKQVKVLYASIALLCASSAQAQTNLFAPKKDGVSEKELNDIVEERLNIQKETLEKEFNKQIELGNKEQQMALSDIYLKIQNLENENISLKEQQEKIKNNTFNSSRNNNFVSEPQNSYSEDEVNEELKYLIDEENTEKILVLDDDILRLNKEFGESGLTFRAILGDKKIYKNSNGEYIVKPLDFELPEGAMNESDEDYADETSAK